MIQNYNINTHIMSTLHTTNNETSIIIYQKFSLYDQYFKYFATLLQALANAHDAMPHFTHSNIIYDDCKRMPEHHNVNIFIQFAEDFNSTTNNAKLHTSLLNTSMLGSYAMSSGTVNINNRQDVN